MCKHLLKIAVVIFIASAHAGDVDRYTQALDWEKRWQKVIDRQVDKYFTRHILGKLSELPEATRESVSGKLKKEMGRYLGWNVVGRGVMQELVDECGSDLLDKYVAIHSGVAFSTDERREITGDYGVCAKRAINESMATMVDRLRRRPDAPEKSESSLNKAVGEVVIIRKKAFKSFRDKYLDASGHKAFAQSANGNWNWRSNRTSKEHAINTALASCRSRNKQYENWQPCKVINVNGKWTDMYRQSVTHWRGDESSLMSNKALKSYRQKFLPEKRQKAFAQSASGSWSWRSSKKSKDDAAKKALAACQKINEKHEAAFPCQIIIVNSSWIVQ